MKFPAEERVQKLRRNGIEVNVVLESKLMTGRNRNLYATFNWRRVCALVQSPPQ